MEMHALNISTLHVMLSEELPVHTVDDFRRICISAFALVTFGIACMPCLVSYW